MDGTALDVLVEYIGWKSTSVARRYVGQTASAVRPGANKRSRDTAFLEAGRAANVRGVCDIACGVSKAVRKEPVYANIFNDTTCGNNHEGIKDAAASREEQLNSKVWV